MILLEAAVAGLSDVLRLSGAACPRACRKVPNCQLTFIDLRAGTDFGGGHGRLMSMDLVNLHTGAFRDGLSGCFVGHIVYIHHHQPCRDYRAGTRRGSKEYVVRVWKSRNG